MKFLSLILCVSLILSGCASGSGATVATVTPSEAATTPTAKEVAVKSEDAPAFTNRDMDTSFSETDSILIAFDGSAISCYSNSVTISGNTVTIQKEGTYLLRGALQDGSIVVDAGKNDKIQLVLEGVSLHSESSAPIYIHQADKVFVTLAPDSENKLSNGGSFTPDGDTNIDAVIFSKDDLTLNGSGTLSITSPGGHGIVSKDSLRITGGTYVIDAASHGLSGQDEICIAAASFTITSGKDGIHSEDSEEGGSVYLESGTYRITADGDGISASGSCSIVDGDYQITTGGGSENAPQRTTNMGFFRGNGNGEPPADARTSATQKPEPPQNFPEGGGNPRGGKAPDRTHRLPGNGMEDIPPEETTDSVSTKGIKAGNLTIDGGSFVIDTVDDGLHADGSLTLRGGTLEIASGDDGIHADDTVTILSGSVNITRSYEGIEGQHVEIASGNITLTATDDGLNAAGGRDGSGIGRRNDTFSQSGDTPSILISGGRVDITAYGDGIDANGTLEITGGDVTVSGPTYGDTSVLDYDRSGTISGGTFIGTGATFMAQTFSDGTQGAVCTNVGSQSAGTEIALKTGSGAVILSHTPKLDFEIVILSAPGIQPGETYTLCIGNTEQSITAK